MNSFPWVMACRLHSRGQNKEAAHACCKILEQDKKNSDAIHLLGVLAHEAGQNKAAEELVRQAIAINPEKASYHNSLGSILVDLKRHGEAEICYLKAITLELRYTDAYHNLGLLCFRLGKLEKSVHYFQRSIEISPQFWAGWSNLGVALTELKNYPAAEYCFEAVVRNTRDHIVALFNLANAIHKEGRNKEALALLEEVVRRKPDYAEAWNCLGVVRDNLDNYSAMDCFRKALHYQPDYPEALSNLGRTLSLCGRPQEGIVFLRRAIELRPDFADAQWNLAYALLLDGQYAEGWEKHEWRWKAGSLRSPLRSFSEPLWRGEKLEGKRLFLYAEQGLGDAIQFSRYIRLAKASGAEIFLEVPEALYTLMRGIPEVSRLIRHGEPLPLFDVQCPLMSLPWAMKTTVDTIPPPLEFPSLTNFVAPLATPNGEVSRVGLVWAGNPSHGLDRRRSIPLRKLLPLKEVPGISYFCAFHGEASAQMENVANAFSIEDLCSRSRDLLETAEAIAELDLVISVDTAVAHLAATMNKPVWLLLPFTPDWRWFHQRVDSPWYPTIRIFRQTTPGDWDSVVTRVFRELLLLTCGAKGDK